MTEQPDDGEESDGTNGGHEEDVDASGGEDEDASKKLGDGGLIGKEVTTLEVYIYSRNRQRRGQNTRARLVGALLASRVLSSVYVYFACSCVS